MPGFGMVVYYMVVNLILPMMQDFHCDLFLEKKRKLK